MQMLLNFELLPLDGGQEIRTRSYADVASGVHIAIDQNRGEIGILPGEELTISLTEISPETEWAEFAIDLCDARWMECSRLVLRLEARCDGAQSLIHPALRIYEEGRFFDCFASEKLTLAKERSSKRVVFDLSPKDFAQAKALSLFLFFECVDEKLYISNLSISGLA